MKIVCRDGAAAYAEAVRRALPDAVRVSDRLHLWRKTATTSRSRSARTPAAGADVNSPRPAPMELALASIQQFSIDNGRLRTALTTPTPLPPCLAGRGAFGAQPLITGSRVLVRALARFAYP